MKKNKAASLRAARHREELYASLKDAPWWRRATRPSRKKFVMLRDPRDARGYWSADAQDASLWHFCGPTAGAYCGANTRGFKGFIRYDSKDYWYSEVRPSGFHICPICDTQTWRPAVSGPRYGHSLSVRPRIRQIGMMKVSKRALKRGRIVRLETV